MKTQHTPGPLSAVHIAPGMTEMWDGLVKVTAPASVFMAAPDLLAACGMALRYQNAIAGDSHEPLTKVLRAAISKAEGR